MPVAGKALSTNKSVVRTETGLSSVEVILVSAEFDQLNAVDRLSLETACRRPMAIAEAHELASRLDWTMAKHFSDRRGSSDVVPSAMRKFIQRQVREGNERVAAQDRARGLRRDHIRERCSSRWRGTTSPSASKRRRSPVDIVRLRVAGIFPLPEIRARRTRRCRRRQRYEALHVKEAVCSFGSAVLVVKKHPTAVRRLCMRRLCVTSKHSSEMLSLASEHGHETADVAPRELLRGHSPCDVDEGPIQHTCSFLTRVLCASQSWMRFGTDICRVAPRNVSLWIGRKTRAHAS